MAPYYDGIHVCHPYTSRWRHSEGRHRRSVLAGRLLHHLEEVEGLSLKTTQVCILDEADRLFELGLFEQVGLEPSDLITLAGGVD